MVKNSNAPEMRFRGKNVILARFYYDRGDICTYIRIFIYMYIMLVSFDAFLQNIISHIYAQPNDDFAS